MAETGFLDRLLRPPAPGHVRELDVLRGWAIAVVVAQHSLMMLGVGVGHEPPIVPLEMLLHGASAVPLFFVASAVVIGLPFARHHLAGAAKPTMGAYWRRRLVRLEPPFLIALLLYFGWMVAHGDHAGGLLVHLVASAMYLHFLVLGGRSPLNGDIWSLEVELQFYVLAPFVAGALFARSRGARRWLLGGALVASFALQIALAPFHPVRENTLLGFGHFFLLGLLVLDCMLADDGTWRPRSESAGVRRAWDVAAVVGAVVVVTMTGNLLPHVTGFVPHLPPGLLEPVVIGGMALFVLGHLRGGARLWQSKLLAVIGGACYAIYLLHRLVLTALIDLGLPGVQVLGDPLADGLLQVAIGWVVTIVVCIGLHFVIERPFMRGGAVWERWARPQAEARVAR